MPDDAFKIDQFTIIGDIAAGQVSDVFEAVEDGSGKHFALKLLRDEIVQNSMEKASRTILSQFKQEFKLGQILEHPNLVHVHEFKFKVQTLLPVKDPIAYFTMDYFRSQNLNVAMSSDPLGTQRRLQKILEQICDAMGYVHSKGWIHRDIKPDNLLLTKAGEARLIDFSLACKIKQRHKIIQGTRTYIAPETIKKQKMVPQTDMYSLGVTIYEVLTGQPPFTGASPTDLLKAHIAAKPPAASLLNENVAPELDRLIERLMAKLPKDRFQSMEDVIQEIRNTRFYIEEIPEVAEQAEDVGDDVGSIVKTLDSRADAVRSKTFAESPELAKQYEEEQKAEAARREITMLERERETLEFRKIEAQTRIDRQRLDVADRTITSPINAVVSRAFVEVGEYVRAGQRIALLHDPEAIYILTNIRETDIRNVHIGQEVRLEIDAYPDRQFQGRVEMITHAATSEFALLPNPNPSGNFTKVTQRIPVRIAIDQQDGLLKPGMMVEVFIRVDDSD